MVALHGFLVPETFRKTFRGRTGPGPNVWERTRGDRLSRRTGGRGSQPERTQSSRPRLSIDHSRFRAQGKTVVFRSRSFILMYHRVANVRPDPWSLCVTPEHFTQHLDVLRKYQRTRL